MKLQYVIVYVDNVAQATEFYRKVFDLEVKFADESQMYAEMNSGETTLSFSKNEMMQTHIGIEPNKGIKNGFELAFTTADVPKAFEKAIAYGAKELTRPEVKPWGQTVAYVQDPFGTIVEICTPMG